MRLATSKHLAALAAELSGSESDFETLSVMADLYEEQGDPIAEGLRWIVVEEMRPASGGTYWDWWDYQPRYAESHPIHSVVPFNLKLFENYGVYHKNNGVTPAYLDLAHVYVEHAKHAEQETK